MSGSRRGASELSESPPTIRLAEIVAPETLPFPDPTEDYHEASRLHPGLLDPFVVGAERLEHGRAMRSSAARSVKRYCHMPLVPLPDGGQGTTATLVDVQRARQSRRIYGPGPISLRELAALLAAAYGVTRTVPGLEQSMRTVPSGGGLFPLELYAATPRVDGLAGALYHYDPLRHGLELVRPLARGETGADLTPYPELLTRSAAFVIVTAMFWRARFKYGARAYRFTLIEAGHVAQNFLLAVEALGLAATPVGGFFDRRVDAFVGADGIYEASLYVLPVGRRAS